MNKKVVDKLIPVALKYLAEENMVVASGKILPSRSTHMKAFGPSIRQAGMVKTITSYVEVKTGDEAQAKKYIADYVKLIMINGGLINERYINNNLLETYNDITKEMNILNTRLFNQRILDTIVACKLSLLTFKDEKEVKKHA